MPTIISKIIWLKCLSNEHMILTSNPFCYQQEQLGHLGKSVLLLVPISLEYSEVNLANQLKSTLR